MEIRPLRMASPLSIEVMRNPLRTKNIWSMTHDPGHVLKFEW
jgi:hypothetical protein